MKHDKANPMNRKFQIRVSEKLENEIKFLADWYGMPAAEMVRDYIEKDYNRVQILIERRQ